MRDIFDRITRMEEDIRLLKLRALGHTETKTFIVGGGITDGLFIPPFYAGVNSDGDTPERKAIVGFRGSAQNGDGIVRWYRNDVEVYDGLSVFASFDLARDAWIELADGDAIRPELHAASSLVDVAVAVLIATYPG